MLLHVPDLFPGFKAETIKAASTSLRIAYWWLACLGLIALFHWAAWKVRFWVGYLSDASYWLYLCHLPLVVAGQMIVLEWPISAHLKFILILAVVLALLLLIYQIVVRNTVLGRILNGPRTRRGTLSPAQNSNSIGEQWWKRPPKAQGRGNALWHM